MKTALLLALLRSASGLSLCMKPVAVRSIPQIDRGTRGSALFMSVDDTNNLNRRSVLSLAGRALPSAAVAFSFSSRANSADGKPKVVVLGGAGYVGAYVDRLLLQEACDVVSVSRSSPAAQADKVKLLLGSDLPIEYKSLDASVADLSGVMAGASAVISLVGIAPGGPNQRDGNGLVNIRIADAAKAAGVGRFVYVGVASDLANGPAKFLFGDYIKGKAEAEAAITKIFGSSALVVKPVIISGGPPGELRPPGPPGVTPVPVEAVAKVVVAGALGNLSGKIDGNGAIVSASKA